VQSPFHSGWTVLEWMESLSLHKDRVCEVVLFRPNGSPDGSGILSDPLARLSDQIDWVLRLYPLINLGHHVGRNRCG